MYEKQFIAQAVNRSAEKQVDRRKLFAMLGVAGAGAAVATVAGAAPANAQASGKEMDAAVLNFALNLEYLEAEFYLRAVTGHGLSDHDTTGKGRKGGVSGGKKVPFVSSVVKRYAEEIAKDEQEHVRFLRKALGSAKVARPSISLDKAFNTAARAAGLIGAGETFDAFANDTNFLLAAFLFEDVGVTAYKGAAGLINNTTYLDAAAGILAVEAYHAGAVRSTLYGLANADESLFGVVKKISDARDSLDGKSDDDRGIGSKGKANITPTDSNGIAYGRTPARVLNVVYLNPHRVTKGGFYPHGVNGAVHVSGGTPAS